MRCSFRAGLTGIVAALGVIAAPALALASSQIVLENRTSATADMYVDGNYGCRALSGLTCTTQANSGSHNLLAKLTDGRSVADSGSVDEGAVLTWTISEE